jgi:hypothetical protein
VEKRSSVLSNCQCLNSVDRFKLKNHNSRFNNHLPLFFSPTLKGGKAEDDFLPLHSVGGKREAGFYQIVNA